MMETGRINNKNVLITGGTSGLGLGLAKLFINNGYFVVLTGRKLPELPYDDDRYRLLRIDFSDIAEVTHNIKKICGEYVFDTVICNAGVLSPPHYVSTVDGLEYTFQVNFLSHLLINEIILNGINDGGHIRIGAVTSLIHRMIEPELDVDIGRNHYSAMKAYAYSKLYMIIMGEILNNRFPNINLQYFNFDPGIFRSGIYRTQKRWFHYMYNFAGGLMRSPDKVAGIFFEIMEKEKGNPGVLWNVNKKPCNVPDIEFKAKEIFINRCYEKIAPFISGQDD